MASLKLQLQQHTGEVISINKNGVLDIKLGGLEPENLNPRKGIVKRKAHAHQAKNTDKDSASSIKIYGIVDLSGPVRDSGVRTRLCTASRVRPAMSMVRAMASRVTCAQELGEFDSP